MENGVEDSGIDLGDLVEYFENAEQATQQSRLDCERDRDYVDHKQWTQAEISTLERRKQPIITNNRIKPKVDFLLGLERQMRTDPKAYPRTPKHQDAAEMATDAIRYVCDNMDFDQTRSDVFENMLVEGTGGCEVIVRPRGQEYEIQINRYAWDRLFWDPHSRARDFSDALYVGAVIWADAKDFEEDYETADDGSGSDTFDDAPRNRWIDRQRKRVRVVLCYFQHRGVWHYARFTKKRFLDEPRVSPFKDENGEPACALLLQSCYVDREGNRYGMVRGMIDIQDEINKRRSKALHLINQRQTMGERGAVQDVGDMKRELAKPDGHVEYKTGMKFDIIPTADMAMGNLNMLQEAKSEIDQLGANAALAGVEERNMSGRALMARQQSGTTELGSVFDSLRAWQKRVYRAVWNRVQQFWKAEKWIRVTDDERRLKWVGLNTPVTLGQQIQQQFGQIPPQFANDPRLQQVVAVENEVSELDVDIILEDVPDTVTIQGEQFQMLGEMFRANPQAIPFDMIIEASSLRNKDRILERLQGDPQKAQMQQQMAMEAYQLEKAGKMAEIEQDKAKAFRDTAEANETIVDTQLKTMGIR